MVVDGSSDPDVEKQQQPPPPTTKAADDQLTPPGACFRRCYEYCKAKACSWPAALALVVVLAAGAALLVVWGDYWDYLMFALIPINFCLCSSMLALDELPYPDDHQDGRWRRLVLPWARAVAEHVAVWSLVMAFPTTLVFVLSCVFGIVQSLLRGQRRREDPAVC